MAHTLPPLNSNDFSHMLNLRPLDFSDLPIYNDLASSRINDAIVSPLCSASARRSPTLAASSSFPNFSFTTDFPYFGSLSPLLGTPKTSKQCPSIPTYTSDQLFSDCTFLSDTSNQKPTAFDACTSPPFDAKQSYLTAEPAAPAFLGLNNTMTVMAGPSAAQSISVVPELGCIRKNESGPVLSRNVSMNIPVQKKEIAKPSSERSASKSSSKAAKEKKLVRKQSSTMTSSEKAAERRRKNRESSSRCYYNRKRIIGNLDRQISAEKNKLTALYDRALELRHENAKLKKDVVMMGIPLPSSRGAAYTPPPIQFKGYLELLQSRNYSSFRS